MGLQNKVEEFVAQSGTNPVRLVDAVFVMDRGWAINFGDGEGACKFVDSQGKSVPGWVWQHSDSVLFQFLSWLTCVMPRMVRFEPILAKYLVFAIS